MFVLEKNVFNKVLIGLVVFAICASIIGTFLLVKVLYFSDDESVIKDASAGLVSFNTAKEGQEYTSTGMISLDVVNHELVSSDSEIILNDDLEE